MNVIINKKYCLLILTLGLLLAPSGFTKTLADVPAKVWLEQLSSSLKKLNFSTSFVVVKNNQAEPYHWYHGVDKQGTEFEILALLNGPRKDTLRKGNIVSYLEPDLQPYSVNSQQISGPIPSVFSANIDDLSQSYDFISVGKSRILGRSAQIIRIVSKDSNRYGYWLWLDQATGLLLKTALITRKGHLLEQIQFTHLEITDKPAVSLLSLAKAELPKVLELPKPQNANDFAWQVNWLPLGFERIKADRHRISLTKQAVEFMQYSDGLVDISVYVSPSKVAKRTVEYVKDGATVVLNQVVNGKEISVVGKIPGTTAKAIADSVSFRGINH
jgi:sigma-E factor negative regulatory protein RseB